MPTKDEQILLNRLVQLRAFVPEIFAPGSLLYVGASIQRSHCLVELMAAGRQVTILEVWEPYAKFYQDRSDLRVICGDVRKLESLDLPADGYDVVFWWHGPEHVTREELVPTLTEIEKRTRLVVLGCAWGPRPQAAIDGNSYQQHRAALYPEDFESWGYRVSTLGRVGARRHSNIVAVKP